MFSSFAFIDYVNFTLASVATILFILRFIMLLFGADFSGDSDIDLGEGSEGFDGDTDQHEITSDESFQLLSLNTITAFLMMFGWMGLAASRQFNLGMIISVVISFAAGFLALYIAALIFHYAKKLQSSGNNFNIHKLIGETGTVYLSIDKNITGKIQISLEDDMTREYEAVADEKIETNERVLVIDVIENGIVKVKKYI